MIPRQVAFYLRTLCKRPRGTHFRRPAASSSYKPMLLRAKRFSTLGQGSGNTTRGNTDIRQYILQAVELAPKDIKGAIELLESKSLTNGDIEHMETLHYVLGDLYIRYGDAENALKHLSTALDIAKKTFGSVNPKVGNFYEKLGNQQLEQSLFTEAEENLLLALACYDRGDISSPSEIASLIAKIEEVLNIQGREMDTVVFLKRELEIHRQHPDIDQDRKFYVLFRLGNLFGEMEDAESSYDYLKEVYNHYIQLTEMNEHMAQFFLAFAKVCLCRVEQDIYSAEKSLIKSIDYFEQDNQKEYLLDAIETLSNIYFHNGKNTELIKIFRKSIPLYEELFGNHPETVRTINNLALILGEEGKEEEARQLFQKSIDICTENGFVDQECYSVAMTGLAGSHIQQIARNHNK